MQSLHPLCYCLPTNHIITQKSYQNHLPISRGSDVKSLIGIGIFLQIYSQMTSMLYFSCADIGITGASSAMVPVSEKIQ